MEISRSKKIIIRLEAEITAGGSSYRGFIGNFSEDGIHMKIAPAEKSVDFVPGTLIKLNFQLPSGEKLNLPCRIKWSNRTVQGDMPCCIGMEVLDAPQKYKEFLTGRVRF
ncbi:MAG: PilZ domain-containing protein [Deferribacteres bacterium]|nr:PilZ domain-containing protein [Deferribacteres bacterium]